MKSNSLSETNHLAGCFASYLQAGMGAGLTGPLGVGKSAFARFVIQAACGAHIDVPSPTFTLVQAYEAPDGLTIMHMDLYRLESPEDVFALGIEDSFYEAANLVEWPDKMVPYWPKNAISIDLSFGEGDERQIKISAPNSLLKPLFDDVISRNLCAEFTI